jgi:hypothetical protein
MKKLIVLASIFLGMFASAQTSFYHPFPDSSACWNFNFAQAICIFGYSFEEYSIIIEGDTTINNQTYHTLHTPYVDFFTNGTCTQINGTGYKGAIRQDIQNKKVFFIPPMSSTEQLLYDFNMGIGDTVQGCIAPNTGTYDTVIFIDSVLVGNNYRKRWFTNDWYGIYYIEGIGSTFGLIENSPGYSTDANTYGLECFMQNENALYPDTNIICQLITSTNDISIFPDQVKVFPNPSKGSFSVEFGQPKDIKGISLEDLVGNTIFQQEINGQTKVNLDNIPGGTYILTITYRNNRSSNRKIISCP